jgi:hypothetical protein
MINPNYNNMNMQTVTSIRYDDNFENYIGFFDHNWAREFEPLTKGTNLNEIALRLLIEWKSISCGRRWPWMMMHGIKDGIEAALNYGSPVKFTYDLQSIWRNYLSEREFLMGLWMSEITSYCAVYFAYEVFIVRSLKVASGSERLRTHQVYERIVQLLGSSIANSCWQDSDVELARLIRHAAVHNGRQITSALEKYRQKLVLQNDEIVIFARDTNQLFELLKTRVQVFTKAIVQVSGIVRR